MADEAPMWRVHLVMLTVVAVWGGAFTAIKVALEYVSPAELVALRFGVAAIPFVGVLLVYGVPRFERREWPSLVAVAFLSVAGYHLALNYGELSVPAGTAALIVATMPAWTALLSSLALREQLTARKLGGIGLALAGVTVLVVGQGYELGIGVWTGALITLLAPIAWAVSSVLSKPLLVHRRSESFTAVATLLGTLPVLPLLTGTPAKVATGGATAWGAILFLGLLATAGGYIGFNYGLRALPATQATAYIYLNPVFGVVWGLLVLDEAITLPVLAGGALVILGVALTNTRRRPKAPAPAPAQPQPETRR